MEAEPNNLMLQAAVNRLQYWQQELLLAEASANAARMQECASYIKEYGVLIGDMTGKATRA